MDGCVEYHERLDKKSYNIVYDNSRIFFLNFHSLEVVARWRDPQIQVGENRYIDKRVVIYVNM